MSVVSADGCHGSSMRILRCVCMRILSWFVYAKALSSGSWYHGTRCYLVFSHYQFQPGHLSKLPVPSMDSTFSYQVYQLVGTVSLRLYRPTTPPLPNPLARHSLLAAARRENWSVAFPGTSRSSRRATSPSRATRRGCGGGCIWRSCDYIGGADRM